MVWPVAYIPQYQHQSDPVSSAPSTPTIGNRMWHHSLVYSAKQIAQIEWLIENVLNMKLLLLVRGIDSIPSETLAISNLAHYDNRVLGEKITECNAEYKIRVYNNDLVGMVDNAIALLHSSLLLCSSIVVDGILTVAQKVLSLCKKSKT